jgi:hypothetical protein
MSQLHWTGAAVLLALAVLGGDGGRPRRPKTLSWADFAPDHDLGAQPRQVSDKPPRPAALIEQGRLASEESHRCLSRLRAS